MKLLKLILTTISLLMLTSITCVMADYDIELPIKAGTIIHFRCNPSKNSKENFFTSPEPHQKISDTEYVIKAKNRDSGAILLCYEPQYGVSSVPFEFNFRFIIDSSSEFPKEFTVFTDDIRKYYGNPN